MSTEYKFLILEDEENDAELIMHQVKAADIVCRFECTDNEVDFKRLIDEFEPDLILSDYSLPTYNGMSALSYVLEHSPDIPVILVTGSLNEETAVSCMKAGAVDYILKDNMNRLGLAVITALENKKVKTEKQMIRLKLHEEVIERRQKEVSLLKINRAYKVLSSCNELLIRVKDEKELLQGVCRIIVAEGGYKMAWVGFAEQDEEKTVRPVAQAGYEDGYLDAIQISWADIDSGNGPTSAAILTGNPSINANLLNEPDLDPWHADAAKLDYASSISLPMKFEKRALAVLNIYAVEQDAFGNDEIDLLIGLASDLAYGVKSLRLQAKHLQVETVLRESEERYRSLTQTASDAIISIDSKGGIVSWNKGAQEMFGYTEKEILNRQLTLCMPERYRSAHEKGVKQLLSTGKPHIIGKTVELYGLNKNGDEFPMELSLSSWETSKGKYFTGIIRDISERMKADEEMLKLSYAVEQSPVAVIITDLEGSIEYVNPRFIRMSGYSTAEIIGKQPDIFASDEFLHDVLREMMETITAGEEWRGEYKNKKRNGELYYVSSSVSAIRDSEGKITHFLAVQEDITEKKILEMQLIQAQKMETIGTLAGGVAHDFNNLLGVIIGYSDYLLINLNKEDQMYKIMQDIRKAGQRGAGLTDQLLAFSRKQAIQPEILVLNRVVADTEKILGRLIGEDIKLIVDMEPELLLVKADQGQITQILMNLAVNARDAMAEGGKIVIKTENVDIDEEFCKRYSYARPGRFVRLSFEDTGCGMDQKTQSHIFEPFFTTKETGRGTGLGLSVIFGIVKQHNGWVNVYSEPGQGSVFRVYLPVSFASGAEEAEGEVSIEDIRGHGERVLLVEDEEMLREFTARTLSENGYVVFAAATVKEALELFEREKGEFNIVFSDVVLPDINGIKLIDKLLEKKPELKVLLSSGYMDDKSRLSVIQDRELNFLQKPYTLDQLLKKMKEVFK